MDKKNNIWAPWRIKYILEEKKDGCIFCQKSAENKDKENYIVHRAKHSFIIMNLFPYNNGHLMVVPYRHLPSIEELSSEEHCEISELVAQSVKALKKKLKPEGFNIGMNIGRIAGAGIDSHIHMHVVPRWAADTNFMPVISDTNIIPQSLNETYELIKQGFRDG